MKNSHKRKVKLVDYNYKYQDSVDLSAKGNSPRFANENNYTKEEGTQSRVIDIEPICISEQEQTDNSSLKPIPKTIAITLKDAGEEGYCQVTDD